MSGGRATVRAHEDVSYDTQVGDVSAVAKAGHPFLDLFSVECKHLASLKFETMIFGDCGKREEIWDKPMAEANAAHKLPFVVAKQNNRPPVLLVCPAGYDILTEWGLTWPPQVVFPMYRMNVFFYREVLQGSVPLFRN